MQPYLQLGDTCYRWQKLIGCLKLQVIFRKRATNYRALLRKMTYEDKASYDFTPPCGGMVISFHVKWDDFISFTCEFISHVKCEWVNDMCRSHVTCVWNEFTCEWGEVISFHMSNEFTCEWGEVISFHMWNEFTCEWVIDICISHVTCKWVMSHANASCHTPK